jgi:hypothetical protein
MKREYAPKFICDILNIEASRRDPSGICTLIKDHADGQEMTLIISEHEVSRVIPWTLIESAGSTEFSQYLTNLWVKLRDELQQKVIEAYR